MHSTPHLVSDTFPPSQVGPGGGGYHIYTYAVYTHTFILVKNRGHVNLAHVHQDTRAHSDPVGKHLGLNKNHCHLFIN